MEPCLLREPDGQECAALDVVKRVDLDTAPAQLDEGPEGSWKICVRDGRIRNPGPRAWLPSRRLPTARHSCPGTSRRPGTPQRVRGRA